MRLLGRLICALVGHRYREISVNPRKAINLGHLHPLAGYKAECERCHDVWDDLWSPYFDECLSGCHPRKKVTREALSPIGNHRRKSQHALLRID